jgi:hypothetical protein
VCCGGPSGGSSNCKKLVGLWPPSVSFGRMSLRLSPHWPKVDTPAGQAISWPVSADRHALDRGGWPFGS